MQFSLALFLAWAVVGGAWAWSSSEVSCASCGSECQSACGTRNFRACCFNFQRRRRSQPVAPRHQGSMSGGADWRAIRGALMFPATATTTGNAGGGPLSVSSRSLPLTQLLGTLDAAGPAPHPPPRRRDTNTLASVLSSLLQESNEEEADQDDLLELEGEGGGEGLPDGGADDATLSRLVALALHQPPPPPPQRSGLHQRYPAHAQPPPPSQSDVGK